MKKKKKKGKREVVFLSLSPEKRKNPHSLYGASRGSRWRTQKGEEKGHPSVCGGKKEGFMPNPGGQERAPLGKKKEREKGKRRGDNLFIETFCGKRKETGNRHVVSSVCRRSEGKSHKSAIVERGKSQSFLRS